MIYISIDIETTGLDPENCEILSIGAIIEDTTKKLPFSEIPKFHCIINRKTIKGEMFAINMNKEIIEKIVNYQNTIVNYQNTKPEKGKVNLIHESGMQFLSEDEVVQEFYWWLFSNRAINFDVERMLIAPINNHIIYGKVPQITSKTEKAVITVAGKNFASFDKLFLQKLPRWKQLIHTRSRVIDPSIYFTNWDLDVAPPGLSLCKERAGLNSHVTHDALEDAWDVILLLRKTYTNA